MKDHGLAGSVDVATLVDSSLVGATKGRSQPDQYKVQ